MEHFIFDIIHFDQRPIYFYMEKNYSSHYTTVSGIKIENIVDPKFPAASQLLKGRDGLDRILYNNLIKMMLPERIKSMSNNTPLAVTEGAVPIYYVHLPYEDKESAMKLAKSLRDFPMLMNPDILVFAINYCHDQDEPERWSIQLPDDILKNQFGDTENLAIDQWQFLHYCIFRKYLLYKRPQEAVAVKLRLEELLEEFPLFNFYSRHMDVDLWRFFACNPDYEVSTSPDLIDLVVEFVPFVRKVPLKLHHPEVYEIFRFGVDMPVEILSNISVLPKETLVKDLRLVLEDGVTNFNMFRQLALKLNTQDYSRFIYHATTIISDHQFYEASDALFPYFTGQEYFGYYFGAKGGMTLERAFLRTQMPPWSDMLKALVNHMFDLQADREADKEYAKHLKSTDMFKHIWTDEFRNQKLPKELEELIKLADEPDDVGGGKLLSKEEVLYATLDGSEGLQILDRCIPLLRRMHLNKLNFEAVEMWCFDWMHEVSGRVLKGEKWCSANVFLAVNMISSIHAKDLQKTCKEFYAVLCTKKNRPEPALSPYEDDSDYRNNEAEWKQNHKMEKEVLFMTSALKQLYVVTPVTETDLDFDMSPSWDTINGMMASTLNRMVGNDKRATGNKIKQEPNEVCLCGSGRKYKKCCGQR